MRPSLRKLWMTISIKRKIGIFAAMVILIMALSASFNVWITNVSLGSFGGILNDNSRCNDFQEALDQEIRAFEHYVRNADQESRDTYRVACVRTERCLWSLPSEYRRIGKERSARTWNIRNAYEGYKVYRDDVAEGNKTGSEFVDELYYVYKMQEYLQGYTGCLVQITMAEGTEEYQKEAAMFSNIPYIIVAISIALMIIAIWLTKILSNSVAKPIVSLAASTRKVAANDFDEPDLIIENKDEMGELVTAFNVMKHSTKGYIATMKENNKMQELLHKEELERSEMEKQLGSARLELLKSQINPHFLFNTLNSIKWMSVMSGTEHITNTITALGRLLEISMNKVNDMLPIEEELENIKSYIKIQQVRYPGRFDVAYHIEEGILKEHTLKLILQPLVENSILHNIEARDFLMIDISGRCENGIIILQVQDNGTGMDADTMKEILKPKKQGKKGYVFSGLGVSNVQERIQLAYGPDYGLQYDSDGNSFTTVTIRFPQHKQIDSLLSERRENNDKGTDCR